MAGRSSKAMPGGFTRFGPDERHRAGALGPDGIDQHVPAARLDQKRRVSDVGDAQPLAVEARRRTVRRKRAGEAARPRLSAFTQLPFEERAGSPRAHAARIEEAHAVEMIGCGTAVVGVGAAAGQERPAACTGGGDGAQHLQQATATGHRAVPRPAVCDLDRARRSSTFDCPLQPIGWSAFAMRAAPQKPIVFG